MAPKKRINSIADLAKKLNSGNSGSTKFNLVGEGDALLASSASKSLDSMSTAKQSAGDKSVLERFMDEFSAAKKSADNVSGDHGSVVKKSADDGSADRKSRDMASRDVGSLDKKSVDDVSADKRSTDVESLDKKSGDVESMDKRSTDGGSRDRRSMDVESLDKKSGDVESMDDVSADKKSVDGVSVNRRSAYKKSAAKRSTAGRVSDASSSGDRHEEGEVAANFQSHRRSLNGVCELRRIRKKIPVESYIFDSLISEINSPSASLVYIYLYRRTIAEGEQSIQISGTILSEVLGFSSKAARSGIKHLIELGLLELLPSEKSSMTPSYRVLTPFN